MSESRINGNKTSALKVIELHPYASGNAVPTNEEQYDARIRVLGNTAPKYGPYNMYVCDTCKRHILTLDKAHGVTPFTIYCKAETLLDGAKPDEVECKGYMQSVVYRLPQDILLRQQPKVDMTWRYPTWAEFEKLPDGHKEHTLKGGLAPTTGEG